MWRKFKALVKAIRLGIRRAEEITRLHFSVLALCFMRSSGMLDFLREEPRALDEVAEAFGVERRDLLANLLEALSAEAFLGKDPDGRYRVLENRVEALERERRSREWLRRNEEFYKAVEERFWRVHLDVLRGRDISYAVPEINMLSGC